MDRSQFDALARLVSAKGSRRTALAVLGLALLGRDPGEVLAKNGRKGKVKAQAKAKAKAKSCYPGTRCAPGKGKNTSGCDFSGSTVFLDRDVRGANLSNSNFTGAQLARADLRGTNLSGSCFLNANLLDAKLGSSVNLGNAYFCRTLMPDGSLNDRDCDKENRCCRTCQGEGCAVQCRPFTARCFIDDVELCCGQAICTPSNDVPISHSCQIPCTSDSQCQALLPDAALDVVCASDPKHCPHLNRCCTNKSCIDNGDCFNSHVCCGEGDRVCCFSNQQCTGDFPECRNEA